MFIHVRFQREVEMFQKEKSRLEELVVTDPDEWHRTLKAQKDDVESCKATINTLKFDQIPR